MIVIGFLTLLLFSVLRVKCIFNDTLWIQGVGVITLFRFRRVSEEWVEKIYVDKCFELSPYGTRAICYEDYKYLSLLRSFSLF